MTIYTSNQFTKRSDAEWLEKAKQWREAKLQLEKWQEQEDALRQELIALASDQDAAGGGIRLSKSVRKGSVDYEKVPQLKGVDLDPYRKPSVVCWRILLLEKLS